MKKLLFLILIPILIPMFLYPVRQTRASSKQAYQDYLYQSDLYRQAYNDFTSARDEYQKYKTLQSRTHAEEVTKKMLLSRNSFLRSYILLLKEKLNENQGISPSEITTYHGLLDGDIRFFDANSNMIKIASDLESYIGLSEQLEERNMVFQIRIRQIIAALSAGNLLNYSNTLNNMYARVRTLQQDYEEDFTPDKKTDIARYITQIDNKIQSYHDQMLVINQLTTQLRGSDINELNRSYEHISANLTDAHRKLADAASYIQELMHVLRYLD